jgi:hypothetical protein
MSENQLTILQMKLKSNDKWSLNLMSLKQL